MVIEKVELDIQLKNKLEIDKKKVFDMKKKTKLIREFNDKAVEINSPYRIRLLHTKYPHLMKKYKFLFLTDYREIEQVYLSEEGIFSFCSGISSEIFKDIEQIILNIKSKFEIEINKGKIPIKYKILKKLS